MPGALQADLTWSLNGSGDIKEKGSTNSSYTGSGTYLTETEDTNSSSEITGNVNENGLSFNKTKKDLSISLGATGWDLDGGTDSYSGGSQSFYSKEGKGTYETIHNDSGDGVTWDVNGKLTENSTSFNSQVQEGESNYTGGDWISTGSGITINQAYTFSSYDGKGVYLQDLYDTDQKNSGVNIGHRTENGSSTKSDESIQFSNLDPAGEWISTGTASANAFNKSYSDYKADGKYTYDRITRDSHVDGYNKSSSESMPEYTLDSFGSWILTAGTSDQTTESFSHGSYTGDGSYTETTPDSASAPGEYEASGQGERTSRTTITRHDEGDTKNKSFKTTHSTVVDNAWALNTGSTKASGDTMTSSSYTTNGTYTSRQDNFVVTGTATGNGNNFSSNKYDTTSTWNPTASVEGQTEPGGWVLTGNASGSSNDLAHSESTGTGTYHQKQASGANTSTLDGTVNEDSFSHVTNNRDWVSSLAITVGSESSASVSEDAWQLNSGDATSDEETRNNFTISATGTISMAAPGGAPGFYGGGITGTNSLTIERHDTNKWDSKSSVNVFEHDWALVSGSGSATGNTLNESGQSGSGHFNLETEDGTYHGTRFTDTFSHDSFDYETDSTVTAATGTEPGFWTTTSKSASGEESGHNILTKSTSSKSYKEIDAFDGANATGSIHGKFHDTEITESNYEFNGDYTLDFTEPSIPEGQWKLTGGSGESFYGEGTGQSYAINGTFESKGTTPVFAEESQTWTINGKIKENGFHNYTGGETTHYDVANNDWNETKSIPTGIGSTGHDYSNTASGKYTRAGIDGNMDRSFVTKFRSDRTTEGDGSNTTGSGSDYELVTTKNNYSYTGEYTDDDGHNIKIEELGKTDIKFELNEDYELGANDTFFQTSGTKTQNNFNEESAKITSKAVWIENKATEDNKKTEDDGSWTTRIGHDTLSGKETQYSKFDSKHEYSDTTKKYRRTEIFDHHKESYQLITDYSVSGAYHDVLPDGTETGTYNSSGSSEHNFEVNSKKEIWLGIVPFTTGTGSATGEAKANYDFTGTGTFKDGTITGTTTNSGETHSSSDYKKKYFKFGTDDWYATGTGNSSASGESHYTYTGTGNLTEIVSGEKLTGTHTLSGKDDSSYDGNAKFSVGPEEKWILTSGTGESDYSGNQKYGKDLSGKYSYQLGPNSEYTMKGTVNLDTDFEMNYSGSYDSTVVQNQWAVTGEGDSTTTTSYDLDYNGLGMKLGHTPYDGTDPNTTGYDSGLTIFSESGKNHTDTIYKYDWKLTDAGESTDSHLEINSSAEGEYSYFELTYQYRKTVDGDYDAGNGSISIITESNAGIAQEKFNWDQKVNIYEETDTSGNLTIWGDTTGKAEGDGQSFTGFNNEEYFRSKFTSPSLVTTMVSNSGGSGTGEDFYKYTGTWSETISKTSGTQFKANYENEVNGGTTSNTFANWTSTSTVITQDSGGNTTSETTTDSDSVVDPTTETSYQSTNSGNTFYSENNTPWTQGGFGSWAVLAPHSADSNTNTQGIINGPASTGTTTSPTTYTDPLAGGPWFKAAKFTGIQVLTDHGSMMEAGLTEATGFEKVRDNSTVIVITLPPSPYSNGFNWLIGEYIVRPAYGDEALAGKTDFELFVDVAKFSTFLTVGAIYAPVLMLKGAAWGVLKGVVFEVSMNAATQFYETGEVDRGQFGKAAYAGAINGAYAGMQAGIGGADGSNGTKNLCTFNRVMDALEGTESLVDAYGNYSEGNYLDAGIDLAFSALMFASAYNGGCFVADTTIVVYEDTGLPASDMATANDQSQSAEFNSIAMFVIAVGAAGMVASNTRTKKRNKFEDELDSVFAEDEDFDLDETLDPINEEPALEDWNSNQWDSEIDSLVATQSSHKQSTVEEEAWASYSGNPSVVVALPKAKSDKKSKTIAFQEKPKESRKIQAEIETTSSGKHLAFWSSLALLLCGAMFLFAGLWNSGLPEPSLPTSPPVAQTTNKNIQDVQLGDWVKAVNPEVSDSHRAVAAAVIEPEGYRVVTTKLLKNNGTWLHMKSLRSVEWLEEFDVKVGGKVDTSIAEIGASGLAEVLAIQPCPTISPRPGSDAQLVTGLYHHEAANALDMQIVNEAGEVLETIGVTDNHPFWSEDRQEFVAAGQLIKGELLRSTTNKEIFVGTIEPRAGPEPVFNLEVNIEHVYYVTSTGVLAHNAKTCGPDELDEDGNKKSSSPGPGKTPKKAKGGAHKNVSANGGERHHAPANSVSPLSRGNGPSFRMTIKDHMKTASWGSSHKAKEYRKIQEQLIKNKQFKKAQQMDIDDVREKFGSKYDEGIKEMLEYTEILNLE
ncbi:MAG: hypothetical protein COA78_27375 [Blastopirellula sp.]|nr:MAG: hypothetical protein COA78_27375 [Blastopirellula sp.]